ncbi:CCA tRNA nucleotidyltransferase [Roseinatronobacter alkalisoli]|uniref:CCA tRNA nucleotidyltransferase n=1 Tax=Roseinatronobacter alkalisoli TaxID=3028235 RepID=A0ABT5T3W1_9RHOB|nr:CCA tRNA nucleotidyltransferase [Roseinatronobacter sp. HJB301]MDD7969806.1 CCA tRNA nucleotidyltransferase [Roseinatronobacter sp. HJB301]
MQTITGEWLSNPRTQAVLALLSDAGHQAFVVGGCVRNALLGVAVTDVDITTDAHPERVIELAQAAGIRAVPTGLDHGTITLVLDGEGFEVTTMRRDVATHGRHATVAFSSDVTEDAARRDFTMNALYADARGHVTDPLDGMADLRAQRVRFVGDALARINEDYLRILRFFRFHAQYGDPAQGLDADALDACARGAGGMGQLSAERIGAEMRKLLAAPDPAPAVAAMAQCGALAQVLPGADPQALPRLVHLEAGIPPRWLRRLLVLGGPEGAPDRLRLTRAETRQLGQMRGAIATLQAAAELGYRLGPEPGADVILARAALLESPLPPDWQAELQRGGAASFPVRAADLPHLQGPALGEQLKALETRWLASGLTLTRKELLG